MELQFAELLSLLLVAWGIIQSALLYKSVSQEAWNTYLDKSEEAALKTATKWDDRLAALQRQITPLLKRAGIFTDDTDIFKDIEEKNEDNPPVTLPDLEPVAYDKALAPAQPAPLRFPPERLVYVPDNMSYIYDIHDVSGKSYPHPNINIHADYGADINFSYLAGAWGFGLLATLHDGVTYHIAVEYTANVQNTEQPLAEWLRWELVLNGEELEQVHAVENGTHSAVWEVVGNGQAGIVNPRLRALYANGQSDSVVQWHRLKITPQDTALKKTA